MIRVSQAAAKVHTRVQPLKEFSRTYHGGFISSFFFKLVQCQSQLNREIQLFGVEGVRFTHN